MVNSPSLNALPSLPYFIQGQQHPGACHGVNVLMIYTVDAARSATYPAHIRSGGYRTHLNGRKCLLELMLGHVDKLAGTLVSGRIREQVQRREARLPPGRHEHQHRLHRSMQLRGGQHLSAIKAARPK